MTTDELRSGFLDFFIARDHVRVASANLIPSHPAAPLFVNAGMVQFLPYFLGEEQNPWPRATSAQKCLRVRGKHDDIEEVGRTTRHLTFFEMLGNFSFGDYFKAGAIEYAWEFLTEVLGLPPERMWATVHETDDEAAELWREVVDMPIERIQRLGEDNFWEMGATGPCGPSSEVFFDKGPEHGEDGGPAHGGEERFVEIWNLVFMQHNRLADGSLEPLPERHIDTGAGLERILPIVQGTDSVFDTDVLRGLIATAEELTGAAYGNDPENDVSLRIVADHARSVTFLTTDGVVPSNEERGYVLRRIVRRAVRHAQRAGAREAVLPAMAAAVAAAMRDEYPELRTEAERVSEVLEREEHRFLDTLSVGLSILESKIAEGDGEIGGETAFTLHDTYGFPIDITTEIAGERGVSVDREGFERAMQRQREQARAAASGPDDAEALARLRPVLDSIDPTDFLGYDQLDADATVLAVVPAEAGTVELFFDRTPFYAERGGQVGDTGTVTTESARGRVLDTDGPLPGLIRHRVEVEQGAFEVGQRAHLRVASPRRDAIRRSHTATHLLHWALRETIGPQLRQQGSLVAPDYLRFDFNHHSPLTHEQLHRVEDLLVEDVLSDAPVSTEETSLDEAKAAGALSFFGEKYGDVVRVVRAGEHSVELCGGTHVGSLGRIGEFVVLRESSIGANLRRIEAVTGRLAHEEGRRLRELLTATARSLHVAADELPVAVERLRSSLDESERTLRRLAAHDNERLAATLAEAAEDGVVVARCDGRDQDALRRLAASARDHADVRAVGLVGSPEGESVAVAVALDDDGGDAPGIARAAARAVGGGGGGRDPRLAIGGGRNVAAIDSALGILRDALSNGGGGE